MRKLIFLVFFSQILIGNTTVPFYQFLHKKHKEHYYSTNPSPKGNWKAQGIAFYAYTEQAPGTIPIYQFLHKTNKDHFLTKNSKPKGDWKAQGIAFYAYAKPAPGTIPIYRFYSKQFKDHYYTKKPNPKGNWKAQGIEFYAFENEVNVQKIQSLNSNDSYQKKNQTKPLNYFGSHNGNWEGFLLGQYNNGSARLSVQRNGRATLLLSGQFNAKHIGQIKGKNFITDKGQKCAIVDLDQGRFKIVLIWTGVNIDVYF